jgi:hypothetical protein
LWAIAIIRVH